VENVRFLLVSGNGTCHGEFAIPEQRAGIVIPPNSSNQLEIIQSKNSSTDKRNHPARIKIQQVVHSILIIQR
jgi:hypothetical protein